MVVKASGDLIGGTKFKVKSVEWTDAAKKAGKSGPVVDANGKKCGSYGNR